MTNGNDFPEDYKETELGILPKDWDIKPISDIISFRKGRKPNNLSETPSNNAVPYLTADYFRTGIPTQYVCLSKDPSAISVTSEDVVFIWDGSNAGDVFFGLNGVLASTMTVIRTDQNKVLNDWIYYVLKTQFQTFNTQTTGSTIPHINKNLFLNLPVPLPPLSEQHAIAATLRTVQEAKEKTDAVIAATQALKAAMMKHLFTYGPVPPEEADKVALIETEIGPVPDGWVVTDLKSMLKIPLNNGYALNRANAKGEVRTYTLTAITKNDFSNRNIKTIGVDPSKLENYWLKYNDIFISRANTPEYVGLAALYRGDDKYAIFTDLFVRIRVDETKVNPKFLMEFLRMPICRQYYQSRLKHTAGNFPKIDQNIINATKIIVPQLDEQKTITRLIETVDQKLAAEQSKKEALDTLFNSLLHDLMTAKIRVNPITS